MVLQTKTYVVGAVLNPSLTLRANLITGMTAIIAQSYKSLPNDSGHVDILT